MQQLFSSEGRHLPAVPFHTYPRPQMVRDAWYCLNGPWQFQCADHPAETILVPYCPESLLSGIQHPPLPGERMTYNRSFVLPETWTGQRILLHFGAVARDARILVNNIPAGTHDNGYLSFSCDITDALHPGDNLLTVIAVNDLSPAYPWGKQRQDRGGMWYTPVSGIWQTVWLEPVPVRNSIEGLSISATLTEAVIHVSGIQSGTVHFEGASIPFENGSCVLRPSAPVWWTPENPHLYHFSISSDTDRVESYFALRELTTMVVCGIPRLCLNGQPYFFNGVLDQGYWSDGLYTPPSPESFEKDILAMKALGYNTLRKHIKVEPEAYYAACDRLGMIVFQDMVNCGKYRYIRDTVLPTLRLQKRRDKYMHRDPAMRANFLASMEGTVQQLHNHPCICLWVIFNEGWGQFCADDAYLRLRKLDDSRFICTTSGWFHQRRSDVESHHLYFEKLHLGKRPVPQVITEFGGYVFKDDAHSFNTEKTYGYRIYPTQEEFLNALKSVYSDELLPLAKRGLCAAIYTQLSDVEDETNGLITFDREVQKASPEDLFPILSRFQNAVRPMKEDKP